MSTTKRKSPLPVLMVDETETETEKPPLAAAAAASAITITINMKYVLVHPILSQQRIIETKYFPMSVFSH